MKRFFFALILMCVLQVSFSQNKPVKIVKIDGQSFYSDEFLYLYGKNSQSENNESMEVYLQRFIDYKLKVNEAIRQRLDTTSSFKKELQSYEKQLTSAYKFRNRVLDSLVLMSFKNTEIEVAVQHLFIKAPQGVANRPVFKAKADSLLAVIKAGADFSELVVKYSDERNADKNKGNLGYITGMKLPFDIENHIFNINVGEVGSVFESPAGYHIMKVTDKRPARGTVKIAHIFRNYPNDSSEVKALTDSLLLIADQLKNGMPFGEAAKLYSDDVNTKLTNGELPPFSTNEMVPEIESVAFSMQEINSISGPIRSPYGWHFIQLLEKTPVPSYEVAKYSLRTKIELSARMGDGVNYFLEKLKKRYHFKQINPVSDFYSVVDDSIFNGTWDASQAKGLKKPFISFDGVVVNQSEFTKVLAGITGERKKDSIPTFVNQLYDQFVFSNLEKHADSKILEENVQLTNLLKEYHDGILLFELLENEVWKKAQQDSVGLADFFDANRENYLWDNRLEATRIQCKNKESIDAARKLFKENPTCSLDSLLAVMQPLDSGLVVTKPALYDQSDDAVFGSIINAWTNGEQNKIETDQANFRVYYLHQLIEPMRKELSEAKGVVIADYQDMLEKQWVKALRNKSKIKIYSRRLKALEASKNKN